MNTYELRLRPTMTQIGTETPSASKYLRGDLSWQTVPLPDTSAIEDAFMQIAWDTYNEDIAFDDLYVDDFTDQTGIDTVNSTATYSSGYYSNTAMVLISNGWEASVNNPTTAYCVLDIEPIDSVTYNIDAKAWVSIDDGSHYEQVTLESSAFRVTGNHNYVRGDISGITARADKTIRIKVTGHNNKSIKLHGWACGVKY